MQSTLPTVSGWSQRNASSQGTYRWFLPTDHTRSPGTSCVLTGEHGCSPPLTREVPELGLFLGLCLRCFYMLLSHSLGICSVACKTALYLSLVKMKYWKLLSFGSINKMFCLPSSVPKAFLNVSGRKTSEDCLMCSHTTA